MLLNTGKDKKWVKYKVQIASMKQSSLVTVSSSEKAIKSNLNFNKNL